MTGHVSVLQAASTKIRTF